MNIELPGSAITWFVSSTETLYSSASFFRLRSTWPRRICRSESSPRPAYSKRKGAMMLSMMSCEEARARHACETRRAGATGARAGARATRAAAHHAVLAEQARWRA
jgi:hypothetical protein